MRRKPSLHFLPIVYAQERHGAGGVVGFPGGGGLVVSGHALHPVAGSVLASPGDDEVPRLVNSVDDLGRQFDLLAVVVDGVLLN